MRPFLLYCRDPPCGHASLLTIVLSMAFAAQFRLMAKHSMGSTKALLG
jgi:hypothetical protein